LVSSLSAHEEIITELYSMFKSFSKDSDVARAIHSIRVRLGMSGVEFAKVLGITQAMVSRYEAGKTLPGYMVLGRLLEQAEGTEKNPLLKRLQEILGRPELTEQEVIGELWKIDRWRPAGKDRMEAFREIRPQLSEFARFAKDIVRRAAEVDHSLIEILALWLEHDTTDPVVRRYFADAAKFLEVSLASRKARRKERAP
jgi:transcriptional regulator with XRE-family HTH domain